jgi:Cu2+-exporting ATPase
VYFDSVAMLVFLLLGARYVELGARQRAARELDHLQRWMPAFAWRLRDPGDAASAERLAAELLGPGDHVLVPAGERVPADGVVVSGASSCDESLLTGESQPVAKQAGVELTGGAVNLEQPLVMRVARVGADTRAAAIARLVERAAAGRPRLVAGADRIARSLTWLVLAVAAMAFLWWLHVAPDRALWVAVAVLVATCPCALALAAPIVLTRANAQLLARGAALTRPRAVEALERATDVVLDKTGTLTTGRFAIARLIPLASLGADRCLAAARAIEASSPHPIARAFAGEGPLPADACGSAASASAASSRASRRRRSSRVPRRATHRCSSPTRAAGSPRSSSRTSCAPTRASWSMRSQRAACGFICAAATTRSWSRRWRAGSASTRSPAARRPRTSSRSSPACSVRGGSWQ